MKTIIKKISILLVLIMVLSCSKDDAPASDITTASVDLGTYEGNMTVADDPQTNLGYVFNTKVAVSTNGTNATIKVTGNDGFVREFTGIVLAGSTVGSTIITITNQTKPVTKTAGENVIISGNSLTIDINLNNDAVVVRSLITSPTSFTISGKVKMIGTSLLKI